jgi:hypothetical protein
MTDLELRQLVLDLMAQGFTMAEIAQRPGLPTVAQLSAELARDSGFAEAVSRARRLGAHFMAERGVAAVDAVDVAGEHARNELLKARLRCDARFKLAAAWSPSDFGNKSGMVTVNTAPVTLALGGDQLRILARLAMGALSQTIESDAAPLQLATPKER